MHKMTDLPIQERPRERLIKKGVDALSDFELLAIIIRTGTLEKSALEVAKSIIVSLGDINGLRNITLEELKKHKGIKKAKAAEILAAIEFGKRVCLNTKERFFVKDAKSFYEFIKYEVSHLHNEEFRVAFLNRRSEIIEIKTISIGSFDKAVVDYREVVRWALKLASYHILVFHNHPSGDSTPSHSDKLFTNELVNYASSMGIVVVDHIIISRNNYYSFSESNTFNNKLLT